MPATCVSHDVALATLAGRVEAIQALENALDDSPLRDIVAIMRRSYENVILVIDRDKDEAGLIPGMAVEFYDFARVKGHQRITSWLALDVSTILAPRERP